MFGFWFRKNNWRRAFKALALIAPWDATFRTAVAADAANYDEAGVPPYELPAPLVCQDGAPVEHAATWREKRRPEILELFREQVYGHSPSLEAEPRYEVAAIKPMSLGGRAVRKMVRVHFGHPKWGSMMFLIYLPADAQGPVPVFVGMHLFKYEDDPPLPGAQLFLLQNDATKSVEPPPTDPALQNLPGAKTIDAILARGYGVASINAEEVAPDDAKRYEANVIGRLRPPGRTVRDPHEWGAIGAWAWSLSRALDYFETDPDIDARRVAAIGHSRMGKTALWAAAQDERFAMAISNNSGCGGAALSKRVFGETVAHINTRFPHWFCENFRRYNDREADLPVDQHELLALLAPRPVYVASAQDDGWADPHGEFLAARAASPVYELLGQTGLTADWPPPLNRSLGGRLGYHLRVGRHALTDFDWLRYLDFADRHLKPTATR